MAGNGLNLGVGIDLSQFDKDISYVNKKLRTVGGQVELATIKFKDSDNPLVKQIQEAQKMYEKAFDGMSRVLYEKIGKNGKLEIFDINNVKEAEEAVAYLKKQLAKVEKSNSPNKDKLVSGYTQQIADVNQYIIAVGKLSDAFAKAGLASMPKGDRERLAERNAISEEIKLLQQKQSLNQQNTQISDYTKLNEEIRLQKELISLLEKKQSTYKNGYNKNVATQINAARNELEVLRQQAKQISENNRLRNSEASTIDKISNLEKKRAATKGLNSKIARYQQERIIVSRLVTQWERYLAIATKLNNTTGVANANAKLDALRKEEIALRNLEKAERDRVRAVNQNKSLLNEQEGLFNKLKTAASNYLGIYQLFRVGKELIEETKYFEQQRVALEGIVGSAAEATKAIDQLKQMSLESPKTLKELVGYTKQLSAYGIAVEELLPTTKKLADLSSGLGVDMSRLILAYGQVNAASVLRGQELRQFTEAGIPLVEKLAEKFTALNGKLVTTGEVFELISKRQVSFQMVSDVLSDMTAEGGEFYKMQEKLTDTLYGQIEKLKDVWNIQLDEVGSKLNGFIRGIVETLQEVIKNLPLILHAITTGISIKALTSLPLIFGKVRQQLESARVQMALFKMELRSAAGAGAKLSVVMKGIGGALKSNLVIAAISLIVGAITNAIAKSREWKRELGEINESFAKDTAKLTVGFDNLIHKISTAGENTKAYADAVSTLKANYGDFVNDNMIDALVKEAQATKKAGDEYLNLAGSIKAAIEARKDWERHETIKSTAAQSLLSSLNLHKLLKDGYDRAFASSIGTTKEEKAAIDKEFDYGVKLELWKGVLKEQNFQTAFNNAFASFTEAGETTASELGERLRTELKAYGFSDTLVNWVVSNIDKVFNQIKRKKEWDTYLKEVEILANTPEKLIRDAFANVKKEIEGEKYKSLIGEGNKYNPLGTDLESQKLYIKTFNEQLKKAIGEDNALFETQAYTKAMEMDEGDYGKGKALLSAVKEYASTLEETDQAVYTAITNISNVFKEFAGEIGDVADGIRSNGAQWKGFEKLNLTEGEKDYLKQFIQVNDRNIYEQQEVLYKEIDALEKFIEENNPDKHKDKEQFRPEVERQKRTLELLKVLTTSYYYGAKPEKESGRSGDDKYTRIRTINFFDEFLSIIKKAEDATKKIVGVTGYTSALGDFVGSLSDKNFLRAFFEQGGNPFADMVKEMTEKYGIEDFIPEFNVDDLKTIFKELSVNGETILVPDYEAIYKKVTEVVGNQVIEGLRRERDKYQEGTSDYNRINSEISRFQEHQAQAVEEMKERWGIDEIANKIDAEIRALTDINNTLKTQDEKRKIFEDISSAMGYRTAQKLVYGEESEYERYNAAKVAQDNLLRLLNETIAGEGIAKTKPGQLLKSLLAYSSVGLGSLSQLIDIKNALQEEVNKEFLRADLEDTKEEKKRAIERAKQFQDVVDIFTKGIDEVAEKTQDAALKIIKASNTLDMIVGNELGNLEREYKNSIDILDELAKTDKTIADEKDQRKLELTQDYFNNVLTTLGGKEMPDWMKKVFGENNQTGFSEFGKLFNNMSGNLSLEDMIKQGIADKFAKREISAEDAAKGASDAAGAIALVDAIIKAIYDVLSFATKLGTQIIDWMEKTNDVTKTVVKKADGSTKTIRSAKNFDYTNDMYATYTEKYDSDKLARQKASLQAVQTFNQHIMDGWDKLKSGDVLGAVFETIASIGDLVVDIFGISDSAREQTIQGLLQDVQNLNKSLETIDFRATFMSGWQAADELSKKITVLHEQQEAYEAAWDEENAKKSSDQEKLDEYQAGASEAFRAQLEQIKALRDEIMGTADALAGNLTNALVSAFKNGENAARAWKDAVKNYIGEVLTQVVFTKMIAPKIQDALNEWMYGFTDSYDKNGNLITAEQKALERYGENYDEVAEQRLKDEKLAKEANASLDKIGTTAIDIYEHLPEGIKDYISYNGAGSSLAGGISGITEDTARQLEGLGNSQLMQLITINRTLSQYLDNMDNYSQSQYMANVQTHLQQIDNNVGLILWSITELRDTPSRPLHVTMV